MSDILSVLSEDYEAAYSVLVDFNHAKPNGAGEVSLVCPVHDDEKGSLKINVFDGRWNCFGCGEGGGNPINFYCFLNQCDWHDGVEDIEALFHKRAVPANYDAVRAHINLMKNPEALGALQARGITEKTIRDYCLGWFEDRVCLPEFGWDRATLRQVIKHDVCKKYSSDLKSLPEVKGVGVRLFPLEGLRRRKIWIFEGWLDALLARQHGLNAISITGSGANGWNDKFNKYFKNKEIYICYDPDQGGIGASHRLGDKLLSVTDDVFLIQIPAHMVPEKGDFTDFILAHGFAAFEALEPVKWTYGGSDNDMVQELPLYEVGCTQYYGQKISTLGIVTGNSQIYQVAKTVEFTCRPGSWGDDKCQSCNMLLEGGLQFCSIAPTDTDVLKLLMINEKLLHTELKQKFFIKSKCPFVNVKVESVQNVERISIVSSTEGQDLDAIYATKEVYAVTNNKFEAGKPYQFRLISTPDPRSQVSALLAYKAEQTTDNIDAFHMTSDIYKQLKDFQAPDLKTMKDLRKRRYREYEQITRIYGRHPMFFGMDLITHSVLSFDFRGKRVKRGYLNGLFYGDTRTGKSESAERLMRHWNVGDSTSGENLSFAGLIGGLHQMDGNKWSISWGLMPINDRKLLKIDEFHGMNPEDFAKTSETISSGVATIHKIKGEKAMARARLLIISNTVEGENLSDYQYGCQAIKAIMGGHNEDIARLDFGMGISMDDVSNQVIDTKPEDFPLHFTSAKSHNLIMWAWSRRPDDIEFTKEAEEMIVASAEELVNTYHASIPLVVRGEQSVKLARLAAACAALYFSTDKDGVKVIVRPAHVQMVLDWLTYIYRDKGSNYLAYSKALFAKETLKNPELLLKMGISNYTKNYLLSSKTINMRGIKEAFVIEDRELASRRLARLVQCNAFVQKSGNNYAKTPAFTKFLYSHDFGEVDYMNVAESLGI